MMVKPWQQTQLLLELVGGIQAVRWLQSGGVGMGKSFLPEARGFEKYLHSKGFSFKASCIFMVVFEFSCSTYTHRYAVPWELREP